mgnify:FL=1
MFAFLSFVIVGFIFKLNIESAGVDIFSGISVAISEPFTLLLFGSFLIGMANIGRKKVITEDKGIEHLDMPGSADSLEENDRQEGWYAGKHVTETLGDK